jgi:hypothetical protein
MTQLCERLHGPNGDFLARFNKAVVLGLVGSGLAACVIGAALFDVGRLFSAW